MGEGGGWGGKISGGFRAGKEGWGLVALFCMRGRKQAATVLLCLAWQTEFDVRPRLGDVHGD